MQALSLNQCFNKIGFTDSPFSISPDTDYFYPGSSHVIALSHLMYMTMSGNIGILSGEVGLGKTHLCRTLLNRLPDNINTAYIFNPMLDSHELLRTVFHDFTGHLPKSTTTSEIYQEIYQLLLETAKNGKNSLLVIDEAHLLDPTVLESLRMLSNLETDKKKLLSLILVGQPELISLLKIPRLRPLLQRISTHYKLSPFSFRQTAEYINFRLQQQSGISPVTFSLSAKWLIHYYSKGVPRRINQLCERALLGTYVKQDNLVTAMNIKRCAKEIFIR